MVKVTTNLIIVYPVLGSDEKLMCCSVDVEVTVFSDLFENYIIKIFENQLNFKKSLK
jgi:hypothetical protein